MPDSPRNLTIWPIPLEKPYYLCRGAAATFLENLLTGRLRVLPGIQQSALQGIRQVSKRS